MPSSTATSTRIRASSTATEIRQSEAPARLPGTDPNLQLTQRGLSSRYYSDTARVSPGDILVTHDGHPSRAQDVMSLRGHLYHRHDPRVFICAHCYDGHLEEDSRTVIVTRNSGRQQWCSRCASNTRVWECPSCHVLSLDNANTSTRFDGRRCPACTPANAPDIFGRLLNYSDRSIGSVPPKDTSSVLFGIEVEVHVTQNQSRDTAISELHRLVGPGYYVTKPDGSVANGFEIVTRPDSMDTHREEWYQIFEAIERSSFLKSYLRSCDSPRACCGIHCHVDKSMLGQLQLAKLNMFVNHPNNRAFMVKVAGRDSNSYTSFQDSVTIKDGARLKISTSPQRYVALNVCRNTVEFRMFRGTLNPKDFYRNLDFLESVVEWTGLSNSSILDTTRVQGFIDYVHRNKARFPFLLDSTMEWGYLPTEPGRRSA